jgi:hypothetical protein
VEAGRQRKDVQHGEALSMNNCHIVSMNNCHIVSMNNCHIVDVQTGRTSLLRT